MTFGFVCLAVGLLGVVGGIWLVTDKRVASVVGGIVVALLSLAPILVGVVFLTWDTTG